MKQIHMQQEVIDRIAQCMRDAPDCHTMNVTALDVLQTYLQPISAAIYTLDEKHQVYHVVHALPSSDDSSSVQSRGTFSAKYVSFFEHSTHSRQPFLIRDAQASTHANPVK